MNLTRPIICFATVDLATVHAMAGPPPSSTWKWVALKVLSCRAVTFEAPLDSGSYVSGDSHRTAVFQGQVVGAGFQLSHVTEPVPNNLPQLGTTTYVSMRNYDESLCKTAAGKTLKFNFEYSCDTLPIRGSCLSTYQLVDLVELTPNPTARENR